MKKIVIIVFTVIVGVGGFYGYIIFNDNKKAPEDVLVENVLDTDSSEEFSEEDNKSSVDPITVEESDQEGWVVYTSAEWKYSFEYPSDYVLTEKDDGYRIVVSPPEVTDPVAEFFSVVVIQYPPVDKDELPESLFHVANFPDGDVAWLKEKRLFKYENYFVDSQDVAFGVGDREAVEVRETSISTEVGEHRALVYVLRDPVIYRVTHDLASEDVYGDVLNKIEDSFKVIE